MIFKLIRRCVHICLLMFCCLLGVVACCYWLASSTPAFYAAALEQPVNQADSIAATAEFERMTNSLGLFLKLDAEDFRRLQEMPPEQLDVLVKNPHGDQQQVARDLKKLIRSPDVTQDTFAYTVAERHLNAWLEQEFSESGGKLRRPHLSLADDMIRFAITLETPATDVVLSCEFAVAKSQQTDLTFQLHRVLVGKLPLPAATILEQYLKTDPVLPEGIALDVSGERPTLTISTVPDDAKIRIEALDVREDEIHVVFRRTDSAIVAAN